MDLKEKGTPMTTNPRNVLTADSNILYNPGTDALHMDLGAWTATKATTGQKFSIRTTREEQEAEEQRKPCIASMLQQHRTV